MIENVRQDTSDVIFSVLSSSQFSQNKPDVDPYLSSLLVWIIFLGFVDDEIETASGLREQHFNQT